MRDDKQLITTGIAQQAQHSAEFQKMASKGLIDFLREQITDAEWTVARAKAEIAAYEQAIAAIESRGEARMVNEPACPGHVALGRDGKVCARCGTHIDSP